MNTYLVWYNSDEEYIRKWELEREYWVDTILEQAASEGIILERPADPTEPTPSPASESYGNNPFVDGFIDGVLGKND